MHRSIATVLVSMAALALGAGAALADMTITCPLTQARRTITNDLPEGWWTTPMVSRFSGTRIGKISGRTALYCDYGSSGFVQRYAPKGYVCKIAARGFRCSRVASVPRTYSTGKLDVPQTYTFDLDRGQLTGDHVDLKFEAETRDLLYLTPRNGAQLSVGDRSNRGYAGCSAARYSGNRVSLRDVPVGSYICVRTDQGRISQFRLNAIKPGRVKTLSIGYTTWS